MADAYSNREISLAELPRYETIRYQQISLQQRTKSLVELSILLVVFMMGGGIYFYFLPADWLSLSITGFLALLFAIRYIDIVLKQVYYGYALREKDVVYRRGYMVNKITVIPFNRIQHVAISRSFFDKLFGVASLQIFTAGGSGSDINIPGLLPDTAHLLRDTLSQKIAAHAF